ncbi:MAG: hypothetical protein KDA41_17930 [Planctomycetales bacterium]|nr:hypothetical protein [Planctomycetales bacterium]
MSQQHPLVRLLQEDSRYAPEAYQFVCDALSYGQQVLGLGEEQPRDEDEPSAANPFAEAMEEELDDDEDAPRVERHITGQELCEAIRQYGQEQYGYLAKVVLNSWGVKSTGDFGEIVFNLVRVGRLKKSPDDRREDFDDCYDFDEAFQKRYQITMQQED